MIRARTLMFLFFAGLPGAAQTSHGQSGSDTAAAAQLPHLAPEIVAAKPLFHLPLLFGDASFYNDTSRFLLMEGFVPLSERFGVQLSEDPHPLSDLRLHWNENTKIQLFQSVLGAAEGAGAAYLTYRHLKKYGFMK